MKGNGNETDYPLAFGSDAFENNLFTSDRALKASYSLNGLQATKSLEGVKLTLVQVPFIISGTNSFENMLYGIFAKKSRLIIDQAQFKNIISEFTSAPPPFNYKYPPLETGAAVCLTESSSLKYEGRGHGGVDIENCQIGVIAHSGSVLDMQNVYIFDAQIGVFLLHNIGGNYFIKHCYFSSRESGIELHLCNPHNLEIFNNEFHAMSDVNAAIRTNDFLLSHTQLNRKIIGNRIFLDGLSTGFNFNGTHGYLISKNHITFNEREDALQTGTFLSNSENNNLKCNTYSTLLPGQHEDDFESISGTGIVINHAPYNIYECNTHHTLKSWFINGSCDKSKITGNYNQWHDIGLYMTDQAMIGPQLKHVNYWSYYSESGSFDHIEAIYDTDNALLIADSRFETQSGWPWTPNWKTQISNFQNPQAGPWFTSVGPPYEECNFSTCEQYTSNFEGEWTSLDSLISRQERNVLPDFRDGTWFNTQWHLYDRIQRGYYDVLTQEASDFRDSLYSGHLGNLYTASDMIRGLYDFNAAHEEYRRNLNEVLQQVSILNDQIRAIPDSMTTQIADLTSQRDAALQNANQIYTQVNNYTGPTAAQVQQIAQQAIDLLPISTDEVVSNLAYALKTFAVLRAQNALPGTAVRDSLMSIATQCPDDGGIGVHLARALLSAWGLYIGEDPACTQVAEPRDSPPTIDEMNVNFLKLVPNPANTMVRLSLLDDIQMKEIKVFNSHGLLVIYKNIASTSQYDLDIRTLPAGIYIVQAMDAAHKSYHARLSCIR